MDSRQEQADRRPDKPQGYDELKSEKKIPQHCNKDDYREANKYKKSTRKANQELPDSCRGHELQKERDRYDTYKRRTGLSHEKASGKAKEKTLQWVWKNEQDAGWQLATEVRGSSSTPHETQRSSSPDRSSYTVPGDWSPRRQEQAEDAMNDYNRVLGINQYCQTHWTDNLSSDEDNT